MHYCFFGYLIIIKLVHTVDNNDDDDNNNNTSKKINDNTRIIKMTKQPQTIGPPSKTRHIDVYEFCSKVKIDNRTHHAAGKCRRWPPAT